MPRKLNISLRPQTALTVTRVRTNSDRMVYVFVANKPLLYKWGNKRHKSRIAYIGVSQRGLRRLTESVRERAEEILSKHGVRSFEVRVVTCKGKKHVRTWEQLEDGFLNTFKREFGSLPICNTKEPGDSSAFENHFNPKRIREVIRQLS